MTTRHAEARRSAATPARIVAADATWIPDIALFQALHQPGATMPMRMDVADPGWEPVDVVRALPRGETVYLLEGAGGPADLERRAILAWSPECEWVLRGHALETWVGRRCTHRTRTSAPLDALRAALAAEGAAPPALADGFSGGLAGYVAYDFKNHLERLPDTVRDDLRVPDFRFGLVRRVLVWDRAAAVISVRASVKCGSDWKRDWTRARAEVLATWNSVRAALSAARRSRRPAARPGAADALLQSNLTRAEYDRMLARCREHILAGDLYQANLSHRFSAPFTGSGIDLYQRLRAINPSPFAAYLRFPEHDVVSCSPERLVKLEHGRVETRPIAGTRPRVDDRVADRRLQRDLLSNEKERAEHLMIVDMARNDIGRVCEAGSVEVERFMQVESYSHVRHLVSNVAGSLASGRDAFDVLAAAFPGASITGVPKVRCMEIVDTLEKVRRGVYTGSAGYVGFDGSMDFNILIRTFLLQDGQAFFHVGGGIVADSSADREYAETLSKGRALQEALLSVAPARARRPVARAAPARSASRSRESLA